MQTKKIVLGTVQLGLPYGINNTTGQPSTLEAHSILELAFENGVRILDTAEAYGVSQKLIGEFHKKNPDKIFQVMTKFKSHKATDVASSLNNALNETQSPNIYCYSFHERIKAKDASLQESLRVLKDEGKIKNIGVSVYSNEEFLEVISDPIFDIIQIPFNLLDNWGRRGELIQLARSKNKEIHIRSVFLQGIFFMKPDDLPYSHKELKTALNDLTDLGREANLTLSQLALSYALSFEDIQKVILGVDTIKQLSEILTYPNKTLNEELLSEIKKIILDNHLILDPRTW